MYDMSYMWNLKRNDTAELTYKTEIDSQTSRTSLRLPGGRIGEEIVEEFGMGMYVLLYLKWIISKELMYSTWNSAQCYVATWMGGKLGEWIHVFVWLSPFTVH